MPTSRTRTIAAVVALLVAAALSFFVVAPVLTQPETYDGTIASLDEKRTTVLELTAASTAAATAVSLLPGDAATPIADKLADLSGYFLIVLTTLLLEKYLLTTIAGATFHILIPFACLLFLLWVLRGGAATFRLACRILLFGVLLFALVPVSVHVSDSIEATYETSIQETLDRAKSATAEAEEAASAAEDATEDDTASGTTHSGLLGLFDTAREGISSAANAVTGAVTATVDQFKAVLDHFLEALAILLVTSCLIPLLVLAFFLWLLRTFLGIDLPMPTGTKVARAIHLRKDKAKGLAKESAKEDELVPRD